jgi:hypothetical protein
MAYFRVWVLMFFVEFRLDSILNKQKIIRKIAFLAEMAKMVSFRPNHKIFSGFVAEKFSAACMLKKYAEILRKDQISRKS